MNTYGEMAMKHWRENAPQRFSEIPDPETFFTDLGEQAQAQIVALQEQLNAADAADEGYWEKVGRLSSNRSIAEEMVLAQLVWIAPEQTANEQFVEWAAAQSTRQRVTQWALAWQDAEDLAEQEQLPTALDLEAELGLPEWLLLEARDSSSPERVLHAYESTVTTVLWGQWEAAGRPTAE